MAYFVRRAWLIAVCGALMTVSAAGTAEQESQDKITAKTVSYSELGKELNKLRGKVVVVDIWYPG